MKKIIISIAVVAACISTNEAMAQQGFGTNAPDKSAAVDITSSKRGLLIPRINIPNLSQAAPVVNPTKSLLVYNTNTTTKEGFYFWNGTAWVPFMSGANVPTTSVANTDGKLSVTPTVTANDTKYTVNVVENQIDINALKNNLNITKIAKGTNNQVLVTNGSGAVAWVNQSDLNNKDLYKGTGAITVNNGVANGTGGKDYTISVATASGTTLGVVKESAMPSVTINSAGELGVNTANITAAGDVTGPLSATKVVALQGTAVSANAPTNNQVLSYNGTAWTPTSTNNLVNASNGLSKDGTNQDIQLGGALTKVTAITTSATNTLALNGLQDAAAANKIVVAESTGGVLRTVTRALSHAVTASLTVNNTNITGYSDFVQEVNIAATLQATGDIDITLPTASTTNNGQVINVRITNTDDTPSGFLNIKSGANTLAYGAMPYQAWVLKSNGTNWVVVGRN